MAVHTPADLRNLNIYSIFVRNYSEAGTFNAIHSDLDRIKYLGTDVINFLPFYPIGEVNRKGSLGSPYAVKNHREIDPSLGTIEDFKMLVKEIHKRKMKVMIEVVLNHTSPDSVLFNEHPEWFYKKWDGSFGNRYGDWQDIIDLDYSNRELWIHQIDTLKYWAPMVDGFHCNFAPVLPLKFWRLARREINKMNSKFIWLAEGIEKSFMRELRSQQILALSDSEIYQAFDISYEYDVYNEFMDYVTGKIPLSQYIYALNIQETNFPWNYVKMQFLENHNKERISYYLNDIDNLIQWTAFKFFQKGANLINNGQEVASNKRLSLVDKDTIQWNTGINLATFLSRISYIDKEYIPVINVHYHLEAYNSLDTVVMYYTDAVEKRVGVFNLKHHDGHVPVNAPDGEYEDLISQKSINIVDGKIDLQSTPLFFISE